MLYSTPLSSHILLISFALLLVVGCSSMTDSSVELSLEGNFEGPIFSDSEGYKLFEKNNILYLGTNNGIYQKDLSKKQWANLGLDFDSTEVRDLIVWSQSEIMAVIVNNNFQNERAALYKTQSSGKGWSSLQKEFVGEKIKNYVSDIAVSFEKPNRIFAMGALPIARSVDRGLSWEAVFETWRLSAFPGFLRVDNQNPDIIWSGGATNIFSPHLIKSTNGGDSWQRLSVVENIETTVYDLLINSNNFDRLLAGLGGSVSRANIIRKSTDGGQSWKTVYEGVNTRTFTHSARTPEIVYASGRNSDGSLFFLASGDFGDTWEMVKMEGDPLLVQVNDMISVMEGGSEVLYFATDQGVFSYRFEDGN